MALLRYRLRPAVLDPLMLSEARACLFFEQRRNRHCGTTPSGSDFVYIRALVRRIREKMGRKSTLKAR